MFVAMILAALIGYVLGSVPFGLLLTKLAGLGDIRKIGSGNIGATNVLRTGRKDLALATLLLDGGKGAAAILLARALEASDATALVAGGSAVVGHLFPIWLGFKGGKGVATTLGTLIAASPPIGLGACVLWCMTAFVTRYSSLAALVAVAGVPVLALIVGRGDIALLGVLCALLVWVRHWQNISRLVAGTEPKIGQSRAQQS